MERLTTRMQRRPAMYTLTIFICQTARYQPYVDYIALTTLQIRRLLLDDMESAKVCIVRCSIYSCAPVYTYIVPKADS